MAAIIKKVKIAESNTEIATDFVNTQTLKIT